MNGDFAGSDFGELMAQVQRLQINLEEMNEATTATEVEGSSGGGRVAIRVSGDFDFSAVHIDSTVVDADAIDLLEDLVLAALRDAAQKIQTARSTAVGQVMSSAITDLLGSPPSGLTEGVQADNDGDGSESANR